MARVKRKARSSVSAAKAASGTVPALLSVFAVLLALLLFAAPTFVILFAGMAPCWVSLMVDHQRDPHRLHTIAACNFAGVLPYLVTLWVGANDMAHALHLLQDVYAWAAMYMGAAAGMAALWLGPHLAATLYGFRAVRRRRVLDAYRRALIEEWGPDLIPPAERADMPDEARDKAA